MRYAVYSYCPKGFVSKVRRYDFDVSFYVRDVISFKSYDECVEFNDILETLFPDGDFVICSFKK